MGGRRQSKTRSWEGIRVEEVAGLVEWSSAVMVLSRASCHQCLLSYCLVMFHTWNYYFC